MVWCCLLSAIVFSCVSGKPTGRLDPESDFARPALPIDFSIKGCYTGAMVDWTTVDDGNQWKMTEADLTHYNSLTGKKPAFLLSYMAFSQSGKPYSFPVDFCTFARGHGAVPYITWEPRDWDAQDPRYQTESLLPEMLSGKWDQLIYEWIMDIKDFGTPVLLRFAHEFNGNWYPWCGIHNGAGKSNQYMDPVRTDGPRTYIDAYRYVFKKFQEAGVRNVVWTWSPNFESFPDEQWNHFRNYYPGDTFVDIVALDVYNWGNTQPWSQWKSFEEIYGPFYSEVLRLYPDKPIMIGEFGCSHSGGDKAAWIRNCFAAIRDKYPRTKIFVYFNVDARAGENSDFRIDSEPSTGAAGTSITGAAASAGAMHKVMQDPYYVDTVIMK